MFEEEITLIIHGKLTSFVTFRLVFTSTITFVLIREKKISLTESSSHGGWRSDRTQFSCHSQQL